MKTQLKKQILSNVRVAALIVLALSAAVALWAAETKNPAVVATPEQPAGSAGFGTSADGWKDPNWKDPEKTLQEVRYDNLPVGEVAANLREQFKDAFDVLLPKNWQNPNYPSQPLDPSAISVNIQLKNVTASEVFNAMNLMFQAEGAPVQWELKMNGKRPIALLQVNPLLVTPLQAPVPSQETRRMVVFVGEMLGDGKSGGFTMEQLVDTVSEVYRMSFGDPKGVLQFHKGAQLLVITGTNGQLQLIQETLAALKEKAVLERRAQSRIAEAKVKAEETKPH